MIRICNYKKGDVVPEWVLKHTCQGTELYFKVDVNVVKYANKAEIYPLVDIPDHDELIEERDSRGLLKKIWHFITFKKVAFIGRPTDLHWHKLNIESLKFYKIKGKAL